MNAPVLGPAVLIGAGLVGASVGCALTRAGVTVHLRDKVTSHATVAATRGAGVLSRPHPEDVQLVVVAVPPRALPSVIAQAVHDYPNATVTDVGSVKGSVLDELHSLGIDVTRYVGSHPMAGSHQAGPLTASADLFEDRTWVITPHLHATPGAVACVQELVRLCGGIAVELDPHDHDRAVATVSHLPHLMSSLVAANLVTSTPAHLRLAGQGLRDVTRIAGSDPGLWEQIISLNAPSLRPELERVHARLGELIAGLDDEGGRVRSQLRAGVEGTRQIPGKHGSAYRDYAHVVVEIPDAPGALGRLFTDIDRAGTNIEDIGIEHDPVREVGYLSIAVTGEREAELAAELETSGWQLRS